MPQQILRDPLGALAAKEEPAPDLEGEHAEEKARLASETVEERKAALQSLADSVMDRISGALPMTPVPVVAQMFRDRYADEPLGEMEIISGIDDVQRRFRKRLWPTQEKSPQEFWKAARNVLELRHLIVKRESGWRWNPDELLLRDYYANALVPFAEVKARGWARREDAG